MYFTPGMNSDGYRIYDLDGSGDVSALDVCLYTTSSAPKAADHPELAVIKTFLKIGSAFELTGAAGGNMSLEPHITARADISAEQARQHEIHPVRPASHLHWLAVSTEELLRALTEGEPEQVTPRSRRARRQSRVRDQAAARSGARARACSPEGSTGTGPATRTSPAFRTYDDDEPDQVVVCRVIHTETSK